MPHRLGRLVPRSLHRQFCRLHDLILPSYEYTPENGPIMTSAEVQEVIGLARIYNHLLFQATEAVKNLAIEENDGMTLEVIAEVSGETILDQRWLAVLGVLRPSQVTLVTL